MDLYIQPGKQHSRYLPLLVKDIPLDIQIHVGFARFFKSVISSKNTIVKLYGNLALQGSWSTMCKNINLNKV